MNPAEQEGADHGQEGMKGVPALQNVEVTGMTEEKQEDIVRRSGRASRKDAANEFFL